MVKEPRATKQRRQDLRFNFSPHTYYVTFLDSKPTHCCFHAKAAPLRKPIHHSEAFSSSWRKYIMWYFPFFYVHAFFLISQNDASLRTVQRLSFGISFASSLKSDKVAAVITTYYISYSSPTHVSRYSNDQRRRTAEDKSLCISYEAPIASIVSSRIQRNPCEL